jgi:hypothetical protein
MSLGFAEHNYEDQDDEHIYTYPRNYLSQWGSSFVSGILETDRSTLKPHEKSIRERFKKIIDICSAQQIPSYFCESAADAMKRIYMLIERSRREASKSLSECLSLNNNFGEQCREQIETINRISRNRVIQVMDQPSNPLAISTIIALIKVRDDIKAPGDSKKELSNLLKCISNRFSEDVKRDIMMRAEEEYTKLKRITEKLRYIS